MTNEKRVVGELTVNQVEVIDALRKKDMSLIAAAAEDRWRKGEEYYIDARCNVSESLRRKFRQGNKEANHD